MGEGEGCVNIDWFVECCYAGAMATFLIKIEHVEERRKRRRERKKRGRECI